MTPSPVFQFMIENPWLAFFLAWPTALVLISVAWCATVLITNTFNTVLSVLSQLCALALTLIRGYPPKDPLESFLQESIFNGDLRKKEPVKSKEDTD